MTLEILINDVAVSESQAKHIVKATHKSKLIIPFRKEDSYSCKNQNQSFGDEKA